MSASSSTSSSPLTLDSLGATVTSGLNGLDTFFLLWGAIMVFFMQAGFAMLEAGCVSVKNTKNVLIKNAGDACIGSLVWWMLGWGFAFGKDNGTGFIGTDGFAFTGDHFTTGYAYAGWFFQWAFAAAAVTITSGAVAERVNFAGYMCYSVIITGFIYPVIVHFVWSTGGWASAFNADESKLLFDCGAIDFAGSGVVHMVGGVSALMAIIVVGPRVGRFNEDGTMNIFPEQSSVLQSLGVFILWFGWYGFNGASTLYIKSDANQITTAKVMISTTIAAGAGGLASALVAKLKDHIWDPAALNNGILGGLVAITAPCSVVETEGAFVIGVVAGLIFQGAFRMLPKLKIDDVVGAVPVHLACGIWGVLAPGFFTKAENYDNAYYSEYADGSSRSKHCEGVFYGGGGYQLAAQICYILAIAGWVGCTALFLFLVLDKLVGMRVSKDMELLGLDDSKHGGQTYPEMRASYAKSVGGSSVGPPTTETKGGEAVV